VVELAVVDGLAEEAADLVAGLVAAVGLRKLR